MSVRIYQSKGSGYFPFANPLEGRAVDSQGRQLYTLQDFLEGRADYVSVAMDQFLPIQYGTKIKIPELERRYSQPIEFRVVDTGNYLNQKGFSRIDICTRDKHSASDAVINGMMTLKFD